MPSEQPPPAESAEERALLAEIVARPDDDTARLVYADWLEEHGHAERGEFIRVQCRLARVAFDDPVYLDLREREAELIAWLRAKDLPPTPDLPEGVYQSHDGGLLPTQALGQFPRGFPVRFEIAPQIEVRAAGDLIARVTATTTRHKLSLSVRRHDVERACDLLARPELEALTGLEVRADVENAQHSRAWLDEVARAVARAPLRNLRDLEMSVAFGDAGMLALAGAQLGNLRSLALEFGAVTQPAIARLAEAPWFNGLRALKWRANHRVTGGIQDGILDALGQLPPFPNLLLLDAGWQRFSPEAVGRLVNSGAFPGLESLHLSGSQPAGEPWAGALAGCRWPLRELSLYYAQQGPSLGEALARSPAAGTLRALNLHGNTLNGAAVEALAGSRNFRELRTLDLSLNPIGPAGWAALAGADFLPNLTRLSLDSSAAGLTPEDVRDFLARARMPGLRFLNLSASPLGDAGAALLASLEWAANLEELLLIHCEIGAAGLTALLGSPYFKKLRRLVLSRNNIRGKFPALLDPEVLPSLLECELSENRLTEAVKKKLKARPGVRV